MTLQSPVMLRNFMRHPAWPDPDHCLIWPRTRPDGGRDHGNHPARAAAAASTAGPGPSPRRLANGKGGALSPATLSRKAAAVPAPLATPAPAAPRHRSAAATAAAAAAVATLASRRAATPPRATAAAVAAPPHRPALAPAPTSVPSASGRRYPPATAAAAAAADTLAGAATVTPKRAIPKAAVSPGRAAELQYTPRTRRPAPGASVAPSARGRAVLSRATALAAVQPATPSPPHRAYMAPTMASAARAAANASSTSRTSPARAAAAPAPAPAAHGRREGGGLRSPGVSSRNTSARRSLAGAAAAARKGRSTSASPRENPLSAGASRAGMTARWSSARSPPAQGSQGSQGSRLRDDSRWTPTKDGSFGKIGGGDIAAKRQLLLLASQQLCDAPGVARPKHSEDSDEEYIDL